MPPPTDPDATATDRAAPHPVLERFSPAVAAWFHTTFPEPTDAQAMGWNAIVDGDHTLILAPTGSGKTLAAFLWAIDRQMTSPEPEPGRRLGVVYVSPLRALAVDVERNLRAPLHGIRLAAERMGVEVRDVQVGVRTGDTPSSERQRMVRRPPDILITTPESLYLLLTSKARETLRDVHTVIIDEIHALAPTKRGSHLALSLERLEEEVRRGAEEREEAVRSPQRIALSATQRPLEEIARFLGGHQPASSTPDGGRIAGATADGQGSADERLEPRPVTVVDAGVSKPMDLQVVIPLEDMSQLGQVVTEPGGPGPGSPLTTQRQSIWPAIHPRLLDLVLAHRSTILFVNARRLAERLAAALNERHAARVRLDLVRAAGYDPVALGVSGHPEALADPDLPDEVVEALATPVDDLVLAHHGSLSKERRALIEDRLKAGTLRGLVATSSLELGIDMGAVDLVVQVGSPGSVSRGLQRIGRAGHQVGEPSRGRLFPTHRSDLLETAVFTRRMRDGAIESTHYPRTPLDVLAQHIVAMAAMDDWPVDRLAAVVRRAAPFVDLTDDVLAAVLDLLAGRYPSDEFSELRPRIVWDRVDNVIRGRPGAQRLAVTNPGTIPDRGLFGVFLPDGTRVGELDEEMVHESRPGETFLLGASTWRIEEITHDRVVVTPAPGQPGKMPFWHGDAQGRPYELGAAMGAFVRELRAMDPASAVRRLVDEHDLDERAARNLLAYLDDQAAATGVVPDDHTITVERFRDEVGDWRICVLSPFGARVHAPWAMALERQLIDAGADPEVMWTDDGIVLRLQEAHDNIDLDALVPDPDEVEELVTRALAGTALFTTVFREAAGRALLLPRRRPGQRTALWQQRQRAANLLQVASRHPSFPILLEATREVLRDIFDVPSLRQLLRDLRSRRVRLVAVDTDQASPFAASLLFTWVGQWMYSYDAPLAEQRAAALSLDPDLLRELLGDSGLRDLLDADVLAALELELQHLEPADPDTGIDRRARDVDALHALLLDVGDLTRSEVAARCDPQEAAEGWIDDLLQARRAIVVQVGGQERVAAAEDAARLRDAIGVALPPGLPAAYTQPVADPLTDVVSRYARTHGPFHAAEVSTRLGIPRPRVEATLQWLAGQDRVVHGAFRPEGTEHEWCDQHVLRRIRQRSLAALRHAVEPVEPDAYTRFLLDWHGITRPRRGSDGLMDTIAQLQGIPIPASVLESQVLPARLPTHSLADLDALVSSGEVVWFGAGAIGARDGRVVLAFRHDAAVLAPDRPDEVPDGPIHDALRAHLDRAGASFWPELFAASDVADQDLVLAALWDLVWAAEVTNDSLAPLRGLGARARQSRGRVRPGRLRRVGPPTAAGRWSLTTALRDVTLADTIRAHGLAEHLLERQGVVTAEGVRAERIRGGFASVYPVLKAMEATGSVRRGWFVTGLGAAQFASAGVVDRLRDHRDPDAGQVVALAATDPAQPYGAALAWPPSEGRPARSAGAIVILVDGRAAVLVDRGGRTLVTFPGADTNDRWVACLQELVADGRLRRLQVDRVNGASVHDTAWAQRLRAHGFVDTPRGLAPPAS